MRAVGDWKVCSKCKVKKRLWDFTKDKSKIDGLTVHCKQCLAAYQQDNKANAIANVRINGDKRCSRCGVTKLINEFNHDATKKDGRHSRCKPCDRSDASAYRKRMRDTNPELQRQRWREASQDYYYKTEGWLIKKLYAQDRKRDKELGL